MLAEHVLKANLTRNETSSLTFGQWHDRKQRPCWKNRRREFWGCWDVLLHACPKLRIIASSREALGIDGENAYRVPSLSLPALNDGLQAIEQSEAVNLFVERATSALPEFKMTETNASTIAQICQRLDGIALAIELAAARVKILKVEQIAARLDHAFRLLTGGNRTALPRQQTLRALIDWSYNLLPEKKESSYDTSQFSLAAGPSKQRNLFAIDRTRSICSLISWKNLLLPLISNMAMRRVIIC